MMSTQTTRRGPGPGRPLALALLAGLALAGCRDASEDPVAAIIAGETHGALALRAELPALPDLAGRAGVEGRVGDALRLWEMSWDADPAEGRELRAEAYRQAAPEVADALGREEARRLLEDVAVALGAVASLDGALEPELDAEVVRARTVHRMGERALQDGEVVEAFGLQMEASDALRAIAPPAIAHSLLAGVARAMDTESNLDLPDPDRERARRLVDGARQALEAEDWSLAIRRAFYASQLLGLRGS